MIVKIENNICYAQWLEGTTTSWQEVAEEISAHWIFQTFQFVSIFGIIEYVGDQVSFDNFINVLTTEWEPSNANN